ncbi:MAG: hypothetical protein A2Z25_04935 [Planctomycetes bacterium RBG_16_55_9]|nr:MAG: hypothetical protein A2Z25_04935 [Planctomycetes bacterium RBG_16_55_9]
MIPSTVTIAIFWLAGPSRTTSSVRMPPCPAAKTATTAIKIKNSPMFAMTDNTKRIPQKILHPLLLFRGWAGG